MRKIHSLYAACFSWLVLCSVAGAQMHPHDPIALWGIQRDCQVDSALSQAVQERLDGLGHPLFSVDSRASLARGCVGTECLEQVRQSCGASLPAQGILLGGHVAEQYSEGHYRARIRLFRVDFASGSEPRTYLRYERLDRACSTPNSESCRQDLPALLANLAGQLLEERNATSLASGQVHSARPPYCSSNPEVAPFLCEPFPLRQTCLNQSSPSAPACPFAAATGKPGGSDKPKPDSQDGCDCKNLALCSAAAASTCSPSRPRSVLRPALGGSMLGAGLAFLAAGLLITLNDSHAITLRTDAACSPAAGGTLAEPCPAARGSGPTTWILGAGLTAGGIMVLWDPLRLFRDRPRPVDTTKSADQDRLRTPASASVGARLLLGREAGHSSLLAAEVPLDGFDRRSKSAPATP